jgi:hypothetical protein
MLALNLRFERGAKRSPSSFDRYTGANGTLGPAFPTGS